jgi:colanic acid/amylovoran biosynthesis glycosyltransferase
MRVVHVCARFSRPSETFVYDLIHALEREGIENHVVTGARQDAAGRPFQRVRVLNIPPWRKAAFVLRKRLQSKYIFPMPVRAFRKALADIRPDTVLAHFGGVGSAVASPAREMGVPLAVVFHAFDLFMPYFTPETYRPLWESGARAVAVSQHGLRRLLELGCPPDMATVIHCGVDLNRFKDAPAKRPGAKSIRIVAIGRLVEKKGFDTLVRALAAVPRNGRDRTTLDIWGEGPMRGELARLIRDNGLGNVVSLKGAARSVDVPDLLREYDALVQPSRTARDGDTEGIPVTILEAQASGLPVVATVHAGIPEGIPPQHHSFLAREGDADDLAVKILLLSSSRAAWRDMGMRGRLWVERHFALGAEAAAYARLFGEMAGHSDKEGRTR